MQKSKKILWDTYRDNRNQSSEHENHSAKKRKSTNTQGAFGMEEDILHKVSACLRLSYLTIPLSITLGIRIGFGVTFKSQKLTTMPFGSSK